MKILHINSCYYPVKGGVQRYIADVVDVMSPGVSSRILTGSEYSPRKSISSVQNYEYCGTQVTRIPTATNSGLTFLKNLLHLKILWCEIRNCEVVFLHSIKFLLLETLLFTLLQRRRLVVVSHGFIFHKKTHLALKQVYMRLFALSAGFCHRVICVSDQDLAIATRFGISNAVLVRECINLSRLLGVVVRPLKGSLLYFGRIDENKGLESLGRRFAELPSSDFQLKIVGKGDRRYLESLVALYEDLGISDRVHWFSEVDDGELLKLLSVAEFVLLPSTYEGFGITLLEALAAGSRVIANDITAYRTNLELLGLESAIFDFKERNGLLGKISELRETRLHSRDYVVEVFSIQKMASSLLMESAG